MARWLVAAILAFGMIGMGASHLAASSPTSHGQVQAGATTVGSDGDIEWHN